MDNTQTTLISRFIKRFTSVSSAAEPASAQISVAAPMQQAAQPRVSIFASQPSAPQAFAPTAPAVAGFLQRAPQYDLAPQPVAPEASDVPRPLPLSVLVSPAQAARAAVPLQFVPSFSGPALSGVVATPYAFLPLPAKGAEIISIFAKRKAALELENAEPAAVADLPVAEQSDETVAKPAAFHLPARLASVALLNAANGRTPALKPLRLTARTLQRPVVAKEPVKIAGSSASRQATKPKAVQPCFVHTNGQGNAKAVTAPNRAKRRAA